MLANLSPAQRFEQEWVDEVQYLSPMQLSFILRLPHPGGTVRQHARQATYSFAGADMRAINRIAEHTQATVLPFLVSHRYPRKHGWLARICPAIEAALGR